jgi:hypothetical protein
MDEVPLSGVSGVSPFVSVWVRACRLCGYGCVCVNVYVCVSVNVYVCVYVCVSV